MQAFLKNIEAENRKALDALKDAGGKLPTYLQHALGIIKRAEARDPLYEPIVSVQPMTQPVGGVSFYRPKYGEKVSKPAGADLLFRVESITALQWLLSHAAEVDFGSSPRKYLLGVAPDGQSVVLFHGSEFRVTNGLGVVQTGVYEVEGLSSNEGYESFLLELCWRSAHGWPNELHAFAVSTTDGISAVEQTTKDAIR